MGDLFIWLLSFFFFISLIGILAYQLICLADLEFDHINPYDTSSRINKVALPEFAIVGFLCLFYVATRHWFMFLMTIPYLYYSTRSYMLRQHLVDVTEIFNHLAWEKKQRLCKLIYTVLLLCLSVFWLVWSVLKGLNDAKLGLISLFSRDHEV